MTALTHEEFLNKAKQKLPYFNEYQILTKYENISKKILVKHKCGYEYLVSPGNFLHGRKCPKCSDSSRHEKRKLTSE